MVVNELTHTYTHTLPPKPPNTRNSNLLQVFLSTTQQQWYGMAGKLRIHVNTGSVPGDTSWHSNFRSISGGTAVSNWQTNLSEVGAACMGKGFTLEDHPIVHISSQDAPKEVTVRCPPPDHGLFWADLTVEAVCAFFKVRLRPG